MKVYVSSRGQEELETIRVSPRRVETDLAHPPIELLARLPSDECGCPEELWLVDGIIYLIHMEDDGTSELFVYMGDEELELPSTATDLDTLRAEMFAVHARLVTTGLEPNAHPRGS